MNNILFTTSIGLSMLAIFACSDNAITESSDTPSATTVEKNQSSSSSNESSSSIEPMVLCKVSGDWGSEGCLKTLPSGKGDLWSTGSNSVLTYAYAKKSDYFGEHAGELFFESDSLEGGNTTVIWYSRDNKPSDFQKQSLHASFLLDQGNLSYAPFFRLGFYVAGFDSNGVAISADISNWNGLCVLYTGTINANLQLDLGDSTNKHINNILPSVTLSPIETPQCHKWSEFKQYNTDKEHDYISGEEAAKHVVRIVFSFQQTQPQKKYGDSFEILAIGTNRDE